MKITLPEHIGDITLEQFQKLNELLKRDLDIEVLNKRKLQIFTGLKPDQIKCMLQKDFNEAIEQIDKALNEDSIFTNVFTLNGTKFGFIPNFDKIDVAEFSDLSKYGTEIEELHRVMAILFRPISNINKRKEYTIEDYRGTDRYSEEMKQMPLSIVNGALFFFLNLSTELVNYTQRFTEQEQARVSPQVITS